MAVASDDVALEQFKLKRMIKMLDATTGNGTSAITLVLAAKHDINLTNKMLNEEYGKAKNIKSRVNMLSVQSALKSAQERLKRYSRTPPNGLIVFCGEVQTEDGKERKLTIDFEPFKPINVSRYLCDNVFHTEYLKDLLEDDDRFGFLIIDGHETLVGTVQGSQRTILHRYQVHLPNKHGRGGQSAKRYAHLRLEARHNYKKKVGEFATQFFIPNGQTPNIRGLIVAGSAELKHDLTNDADLFDPRLHSILMPPLLDISYGGEAGFNQAIALASGMLKNVKLVQEKHLIGSLMEQIARDSGKYCVGITETMQALYAGAIETLIVWEHFDMMRMVLHNPHTDTLDAVVVRPDQLNNPKWYKDAKNNVDLTVEEQEPFLEWIMMNYKNFGAKLEFVTDRSQEGNQFCRGFGGIGGLMRYKLEFVDDEEDGLDDSVHDLNDALGDNFDLEVEAALVSEQQHVEVSCSSHSWQSAVPSTGQAARVETSPAFERSSVESWEDHLDEDVGYLSVCAHNVQGFKRFEEHQVERSDTTEATGDFMRDGDIKDPDPRLHMNVVFMGHVDAGKSTTCGNILLLSGCVDARLVEKYAKEAKDKHRESWFLAYIMDTNDEERAKGKTVEVGKAHFETVNRRFTILDAPGHRSYVPNMIASASQADVGVLLISARKGEFESGFEKGGQTREHALLAKTLGVETLICAVNKMDDRSVGWAQDRFDEIVGKVSTFLKSIGFRRDQISFLPISGLNGHNIQERLETPGWYEGATLLQALDKVEVARSSSESPFRLPISDIYRDMGAVVATGKIEQGQVVPGMQCVLAPTGVKCCVACVSIKDEAVKFAKHGEDVCLKLTGVTEEHVKKGFVLCPVRDSMPPVKMFKAALHILELPDDRHILTAGYKAVLHVHAAKEECEIVRLEESCPLSSTQQIELNPKFVRARHRLTCTISLGRPVALNVYEGIQQLGRFTLRVEDKTIAIGKVLQLIGNSKKAM